MLALFPQLHEGHFFVFYKSPTMALPSKSRKLPPCEDSALLIRAPDAWPNPSILAGSRAGLNGANMLVGWVPSSSPKDHRGGEKAAALVSFNQAPDQGQRSPQGPKAAGWGWGTEPLCSSVPGSGNLGDSSEVCIPELPGVVPSPPAISSLCSSSSLHGACVTQVLLESGPKMQSVKLEKTGTNPHPSLT